MEIANTKNSYENNVGENEELDIQENKRMGHRCGWFADGYNKEFGVVRADGRSFKARVGQA